MSKLKRTLAGLIALAISAVSIGATTADAYGIIDTPSSELEYELSARIMSDTRIEVILEVTNNPGFNTIAFAMQYSDNCTPAGVVKSNQEFVHASQANTTLNYVFCGSSSISGEDCDSNYVLTFRFDVANANTAVCEFSTAVIQYDSDAENIYFDKINSGYNNFSFEGSVGTRWLGNGIDYTIGDIDNNGIINITDANKVYRLAQYCSSNSCTNISTLNACLLYSAELPFDLKTLYPNLVCAEVADADGNGIIQAADGDVIMNYYTEKSAGADVSSYIVGTEYTLKTLTITPNN